MKKLIFVFALPCLAQLLPLRTAHPVASSLVPFGSTWYETWNTGGTSCGAFTGQQCNNPWLNGGGTSGALVSASTYSMNTLPWSQVAGSKVLQMVVTGASQYINTYIPTYLATPSAGQTITITFPFRLNSESGLSFGAEGALQLGSLSVGTTLFEFYIYSTGGSNYQLYGGGVGTGSSTTATKLTIALNTTYLVTAQLGNGTNGSTLTITTPTGGALFSATFTLGTASTLYGDVLYIGNTGASTASATYEIGVVQVSSSAVSNQSNPPNLFVNGNGRTSGNTVAITDFTPGGAGYGYCNVGSTGGGGAYGWVNSSSNNTWSNLYTISPHTPITVAGVQRSAASPLMSFLDVLGTSTGYVKCSFSTAAPSAVAMWYTTITPPGVNQGQQAMNILASSGDYLASHIYQGTGASSGNPVGPYSQDANHYVWQAETFSGSSYGQGCITSNCPNMLYNHWYVIVAMYYPGYPHSLTIYDTGAGAWQASTAYALNAVVADLANPYHCQKVTVSGTSGSGVPTWNDSGGTTTDGGVTWTDQGVCAAPVMIAIQPGSATPYGSNPYSFEWGMTGEPNGTSGAYEANLTIDYQQGRIQTLTNISSAICPASKPGCPAASDLTLASSTTGTSATWPFDPSCNTSAVACVQSDVNRMINITGTISGSCNIGGGSHPGGAYMITSVTAYPANVATFDGSVGTTGSVCSYAENTVVIGAMIP